MKIFGLLAAVIIFLAGFIAGQNYKSIPFLKINSNSSQQIVSGQGSDLTKKPDKIIKLGDTGELSIIKMRIFGISMEKSIKTALNLPKNAPNGYKFMEVNAGVTNITQSAFNLTPDFNVVDEKGRVIAEYPGTVGNIDNYLDGRKMEPGVEEKGLWVFLIPDDSASLSLNVKKDKTGELFAFLLQ